MGKSQREKGKRGEREVAAILRKHGFTEAHRGQQYHGGGDSPDVVGLPGFHLEVKRVERLDLKAALVQSASDAATGETAAVVHRKSREPWYITMSFDEFLDLYEKAYRE